MRVEARTGQLLVGLVVVAGALHLWILLASGRLTADEAIPGLMARHILFDGERPVFYWGQAYFGAAEAYVVAGLFALLGFHTWLVFAPAYIASLVLIPLAWALGDQLGGPKAGLLAAVPLAVPPPVLARMLTNAGGGFALAFALQLSALLCTLRALRAGRWQLAWVMGASMAVGLGCWVWQPSLVALPLLLVVLLVRLPTLRTGQGLALLLLPAALGVTPMLVDNMRNGWETVAASMLKFSQQSTSVAHLGDKLAQDGHLVDLALGGGDETFGGANPAQAVLLIGTLALGPPLAFVRAHQAAPPASAQVRLATALLLVTAALHTLAAHDGTRYLLPLLLGACVWFGVVLAALVEPGGRARYVLLAVAVSLVLVPNLVDYLAGSAAAGIDQESAALDAQAAVAALEQRGLRTGYADYWSAYPVAYLSGEQVVVAPSLPNRWTIRVDRYPAYTAQVDAVDDLSQLFLLVDQQCSPAPYLATLDAAGARYRVERVARWQLIWAMRSASGSAVDTLARLRATIAAQQACQLVSS